MFTESQCFNGPTTWQTFERLCCDLEQNATKIKSKEASKHSEKVIAKMFHCTAFTYFLSS